ncbi:MAG: hypothetical protein HYR71_03755 [Chloroflexi bacterium]|nr:hypothetical protein [Chloroflexota bacterium]
MSETSPAARPLKRIVFGYTLDGFPGLLIVGYNQLKRKLERARFDIAMSLCPLSDLPAEVDVLFVPAELAEAARQAAPASRIEALDSFMNHPAYNLLIQQLVEGREWTALKRPAEPPSDEEGYIVRYRGYERIE